MTSILRNKAINDHSEQLRAALVSCGSLKQIDQVLDLFGLTSTSKSIVRIGTYFRSEVRGADFHVVTIRR